MPDAGASLVGERAGTPAAHPWSHAAVEFLPWAVAGSGLACVVLPTGWRMATTLWTEESYAHGPIILGLAAWLLWRLRTELKRACVSGASSVWGWPILLVFLVVYVAGRSQALYMFELVALPGLITALLLILGGRRALAAAWFPLFFMLFAVPLPGELVDLLTGPMRIGVSWAAEQVLHAVGYPIARKGVILQVGQYQMLVADACAGLHTLLTLEALGLFYLNLVRHPSWVRNVALAIMILPISLVANTVRVVVLVLVTYHFGDEAGQGFLHGFAGMVLFLAGLIMILATDGALRRAPSLGMRTPAS
jgi:exosortase B